MTPTTYEEIARDAMDGKHVAVFCDSSTGIKLCKNGVAAAAKRLGARRVVYPLRDRRITVDGNPVRLFVTGGFSHRGYKPDSVYLSESARAQLDFATKVGATVH